MSDARANRRRKRRVWVVYDSRAAIDPDEATVLVTAESLAEAREWLETWPEAVIYRYDLNPRDGIDWAENETLCGGANE